jgi:UDP-glucuronate decarboxylase
MSPDDGRVVSNFIVQALLGNDLTIYGDGTQTRSFCYVDDLVLGLEKLMNAPEEVTGPINLGNPTECTVRELAETILDLTNSNSRVVNLDLPSDDPRQRKPDISLAEKKLGWIPSIDIHDGLSQTISYFSNILK